MGPDAIAHLPRINCARFSGLEEFSRLGFARQQPPKHGAQIHRRSGQGVEPCDTRLGVEFKRRVEQRRETIPMRGDIDLYLHVFGIALAQYTDFAGQG